MPTIVNLNGTAGGVTSESRVMVEEVWRDMAASSAQKGWAFACADNAVTPAVGGNNVFCRIGNTSGSDLVITRIEAQCAAAEVISVQTSVAYTSATAFADKVAQNRTGSANLFTTKGLFQSDVDITGDAVTVANQLFEMNLIAADTLYVQDLAFGNEIVLPTGHSLLLEAVTTASAVAYVVHCHFVMDARTDD